MLTQSASNFLAYTFIASSPELGSIVDRTDVGPDGCSYFLSSGQFLNVSPDGMVDLIEVEDAEAN